MAGCRAAGAAATGITYVDLAPVFGDEQGRLRAGYTTDGLHLNEAGYREWANHLRKQGYLGVPSP